VPEANATANSTMHLAATALSSLQELPHFKAKDHYGVDAGLIDFSLLGDTDATLSEIFTNISTYEQNSMVKVFFEHLNTENTSIYSVIHQIYTQGPQAAA
jgi:hypothetical protein